MSLNKSTPLENRASPRTLDSNWLSINATTADSMLLPQLWHSTFKSCPGGQASDSPSLTHALLLPIRNSGTCFKLSHSQVSRRSARTSPFRSVQKMKEPFQLLLSTPGKPPDDRPTIAKAPFETDKLRRCDTVGTQCSKDHLMRARRNAFVLLRDQDDPRSGLWYTDFDLSKPKFQSFVGVDAFLDGHSHFKEDFVSTQKAREGKRDCGGFERQILQMPRSKRETDQTPSSKRPASSMRRYRSSDQGRRYHTFSLPLLGGSKAVSSLGKIRIKAGSLTIMNASEKEWTPAAFSPGPKWLQNVPDQRSREFLFPRRLTCKFHHFPEGQPRLNRGNCNGTGIKEKSSGVLLARRAKPRVIEITRNSSWSRQRPLQPSPETVSMTQRQFRRGFTFDVYDHKASQFMDMG